MKKLIATAAMVVLTACGGGSDNGTTVIVPAPGVPAANVYNAMDGYWDCKNPDKSGQEFVMSAAFSGVQAAWSGVWNDGHEAYVVYDDVVNAVGATLFYSEKRTDVPTEYNTIHFTAAPKGTGVGQGKGPITFSVSSDINWLVAQSDRIWECTRK